MRILLIFCIFLTSLPLPALANPCESVDFGSPKGVQGIVQRLITGTGLNRVGIHSRLPFFKLNEVPLNLRSEHKGSTSFKPGEQPAGIQTYLETLKQETKLLLNRDISKLEVSAIERANQTGRMEDSEKSEWALIREKASILQKAGFSKQEIRLLMESGIVWTQNFTAEDMLIKNLQERGSHEEARKRREDIYYTMSGIGIARIHKVLKENDSSFEVSVEFLNLPNYLHKEIISKNPLALSPILYRSIHPATQVLFEATKGAKKEVSREDIKLSPPTHEAEKLHQQGYGPAWTKGIDQLNEWVEVRRQLQNLRANPRTTHIPYFADQIEAHLTFTTKGLGNISQQQQKQLVNLKKRAKKAISKKKVTYEWWIEFNVQLSDMLSYNFDSPSARMDFMVEGLFSQFPLRMAIPTTQGEIGIIAFNRAYSEGIYPLGLVNQPKEVDNVVHNPYQFFHHDIIHTWSNIFGPTIGQYSLGHKLRHKKMLALMENLPKEKRKQAELVYFISIHEDVKNQGHLLTRIPEEQITDYLAEKFYGALVRGVFSEKMAGLGKEYSDIEVVNEKIQYIKDHIIKRFMREVHGPAF